MIKYEKLKDGYRAYDKRFNWIALSGFGKTKKEAYINFFTNPIFKSRPSVVDFGPCA